MQQSSKLRRVVNRLLANPVIENYRFELDQSELKLNTWIYFL